MLKNRVIAVVVMVSFSLFSCEKNELDEVHRIKEKISLKQEENNYVNESGKAHKSDNSGYSLLSCELSNGEPGCECTPGMEYDCSPESPCAAESSFPTYSNVLHDLFSEEEIEERAANGVRITEKELREALKADGLIIYD